MTTTFERLCAILLNDHKLPLERLTPEAPLESLGIDSLGTVELLWNVEDAFQIKMPSEPVDLRTLGDVVRCIDDLAASQGTRPVAAIPVGPSLIAS
jgi:acyl carrier protein